MKLRLSSYTRLCLSFAMLIGLGYLALGLPGMIAAEHGVARIDRLFTAVSAVCVTGLAVVSTGNDYTLLGQFVILCLIQIGGLGFMTLSSSLLMQLRRKATLSETSYLRESLAATSADDLPRHLFSCMRLVAICEGIGAALLFIRFSMVRPDGVVWMQNAPQALWAAVFHSVSAFCNAGFSIWDDNLMRFAGDWVVNIVICALIIAGGVGFFALVDIEAWIRSLRREERARLPFQTKVVLTTSLGLIVCGAVLIWMGERLSHPPAGQSSAVVQSADSTVAADRVAERPPAEQWLIAVFHSVSARTAGFNTADLSRFSFFSLTVLVMLMFIGASPGSSGGGVKTTTFAVLFTQAVGSLRPGREPGAMGRSFGRTTVRSAIVLFFMAAGLVIAGTLCLLLTESGSAAEAQSHSWFLACLFEVTSALGTVGLSMGVTPTLSVAGKAGLIALMYLGRVGPLGLVSAAVLGGGRSMIRYPEEDVQIG